MLIFIGDSTASWDRGRWKGSEEAAHLVRTGTFSNTGRRSPQFLQISNGSKDDAWFDVPPDIDMHLSGYSIDEGKLSLML